MIATHASSEDLSRAARRNGMLSMRDDALRKATQGLTTLEEVIRVTRKNMAVPDEDPTSLPARI